MLDASGFVLKSDCDTKCYTNSKSQIELYDGPWLTIVDWSHRTIQHLPLDQLMWYVDIEILHHATIVWSSSYPVGFTCQLNILTQDIKIFVSHTLSTSHSHLSL
jgi:hypothetical protein